MKDSNDISGRGRITCPCYDELDAILGTRAASSPPIVLDSGGGADEASIRTGLNSKEEGIMCGFFFH